MHLLKIFKYKILSICHLWKYIIATNPNDNNNSSKYIHPEPYSDNPRTSNRGNNRILPDNNPSESNRNIRLENYMEASKPKINYLRRHYPPIYIEESEENIHNGSRSSSKGNNLKFKRGNRYTHDINKNKHPQMNFNNYNTKIVTNSRSNDSIRGIPEKTSKDRSNHFIINHRPRPNFINFYKHQDRELQGSSLNNLENINLSCEIDNEKFSGKERLLNKSKEENNHIYENVYCCSEEEELSNDQSTSNPSDEVDMSSDQYESNYSKEECSVSENELDDLRGSEEEEMKSDQSMTGKEKLECDQSISSKEELECDQSGSKDHSFSNSTLNTNSSNEVSELRSSDEESEYTDSSSGDYSKMADEESENDIFDQLLISNIPPRDKSDITRDQKILSTIFEDNEENPYYSHCINTRSSWNKRNNTVENPNTNDSEPGTNSKHSLLQVNTQKLSDIITKETSSKHVNGSNNTDISNKNTQRKSNTSKLPLSPNTPEKMKFTELYENNLQRSSSSSGTSSSDRSIDSGSYSDNPLSNIKLGRDPSFNYQLSKRSISADLISGNCPNTKNSVKKRDNHDSVSNSRPSDVKYSLVNGININYYNNIKNISVIKQCANRKWLAFLILKDLSPEGSRYKRLIESLLTLFSNNFWIKCSVRNLINYLNNIEIIYIIIDKNISLEAISKPYKSHINLFLKNDTIKYSKMEELIFNVYGILSMLASLENIKVNCCFINEFIGNCNNISAQLFKNVIHNEKTAMSEFLYYLTIDHNIKRDFSYVTAFSNVLNTLGNQKTHILYFPANINNENENNEAMKNFEEIIKQNFKDNPNISMNIILLNKKVSSYYKKIKESFSNIYIYQIRKKIKSRKTRKLDLFFLYMILPKLKSSKT